MEDRFTELKTIVLESSQVIGHQLQSIDSSLISAFLSIAITLALSNLFGPIIYWIPASFILMWLLLIYSLVKFIYDIFFKILKAVKINNKVIQVKQERTESIPIIYNKNAIIFQLKTMFIRSSPIFKSIGVIFFISFTLLMIVNIVNMDTFSIPILLKGIPRFSTKIPIISSLLFMSFPILVNYTITNIDKLKRINVKFGCKRILLFMLFTIIILSALGCVLFVLPILSIIVMKPIYIQGWSTMLPISLVTFLLIITALIFINYFSASSAKKELTIALHNLSIIYHRINFLLLSEETIDENIYQELKESYFKAKPYEISSDDTLLINFYSIVPNPTYLSMISEDK
jgi:hypothetical protein